MNNSLIYINQFVNGEIDNCSLRTLKITYGTVVNVFLSDSVFVSFE